MGKNSRRIALGGMMVALATAVMLLGGVIPAATFACPALAALALIPMVFDCGERLAWAGWVGIAALSLMLCPDKEAALLMAFAGWYPVAKWRLDRIRAKWPRRALKFALLNAALAAMYAMIYWVFRMDEIVAEYREMSRAMLVAFVVMGNVALALYDRLLTVMAVLYLKRLRPRLFGR